MCLKTTITILYVRVLFFLFVFLLCTNPLALCCLLTLHHSSLIHIRQPCCFCLLKKHLYITAWCARGQWVNKGKVLLSIYRLLLECVCVCLSVCKSNSTDVNSKEIANKMFARSPRAPDYRRGRRDGCEMGVDVMPNQSLPYSICKQNCNTHLHAQFFVPSMAFFLSTNRKSRNICWYICQPTKSLDNKLHLQ